jgi:hypothetical protein
MGSHVPQVEFEVVEAAGESIVSAATVFGAGSTADIRDMRFHLQVDTDGGTFTVETMGPLGTFTDRGIAGADGDSVITTDDESFSQLKIVYTGGAARTVKGWAEPRTRS